jgi:hypothetical protein
MTNPNNSYDTTRSTGEATGDIFYSEAQLTTEPQPGKAYYTPGRHNPSRRQQKHELLLTFMTHSNSPKRKSTNRKAPVKPTLLHTLLSLFI